MYYVLYRSRRGPGLVSSGAMTTYGEARVFAGTIHLTRGPLIVAEVQGAVFQPEPAEMYDPPRVRGSETSEAAAEAIRPSAATLRETVYQYLADSYGATDDECQESLGMLHQTQTARRRELVQSGRVFDSGVRRKTRSGRLAIVWRVNP